MEAESERQRTKRRFFSTGEEYYRLCLGPSPHGRKEIEKQQLESFAIEILPMWINGLTNQIPITDLELKRNLLPLLYGYDLCRALSIYFRTEEPEAIQNIIRQLPPELWQTISQILLQEEPKAAYQLAQISKAQRIIKRKALSALYKNAALNYLYDVIIFFQNHIDEEAIKEGQFPTIEIGYSGKFYFQWDRKSNLWQWIPNQNLLSNQEELQKWIRQIKKHIPSKEDFIYDKETGSIYLTTSGLINSLYYLLFLETYLSLYLSPVDYSILDNEIEKGKAATLFENSDFHSPVPSPHYGGLFTLITYPFQYLIKIHFDLLPVISLQQEPMEE